MPTGPALIEEIAATTPAPGHLAFWWLGQQSWVVRTAAHTLWFDPYLTPKEKRQTPPLLAPEELTRGDLLFGTHDHTDHIDRPSLPAMLDAAPQAKLIVPRKAAATLSEDGVDAARLVPVDAEDELDIGGVHVTAIKAQHEFFDEDPATGFPYLQYLVEADGVVIHHAGDTLRYEGLETRLRSWSITVSFLPINGRDAPRYRRGCLGNMTWQEAADLAGALQPRLVCPAHYEMFIGNQQDPQPFVDYMEAKYPGQAVWLGEPGVRAEV